MSFEDSTSSYVHLHKIASGGLGHVDLVIRREGGFERLYAMKRLHPQFRDDPEIRTMFLDEARIAGLLRHPNVVSVHDVGVDSEGAFLVMDYVEGISLAVLVRSLSQGEMLPLNLCMQIALQVCRGLHAAHELTAHDGKPLGVIHRDVSPQNILLGFDGLVKVIDFGVAKVWDSESITTTGVLKGKWGYMSPEQLRFEPVDRRSDLFALGVILFEILCSQRLYKKKRRKGHNEVAHSILNDPPPDISETRRDAPPSLVELLFALLSKHPEHRPTDAAEVARQLETITEEIADEEPLKLEGFLAERFADEKEQVRSHVQSSLARLQGEEFPVTVDLKTPDARLAPTIVEATPAGLVAAEQTVTTPYPTTQAVPGRRRLGLVLAGVILFALAAGVAIGASVLTGGSPSELTADPAAPHVHAAAAPLDAGPQKATGDAAQTGAPRGSGDKNVSSARGGSAADGGAPHKQPDRRGKNRRDKTKGTKQAGDSRWKGFDWGKSP